MTITYSRHFTMEIKLKKLWVLPSLFAISVLILFASESFGVAIVLAVFTFGFFYSGLFLMSRVAKIKISELGIESKIFRFYQLTGWQFFESGICISWGPLGLKVYERGNLLSNRQFPPKYAIKNRQELIEHMESHDLCDNCIYRHLKVEQVGRTDS